MNQKMHVFINIFLLLCSLNLCFGLSYYNESACGIVPPGFKAKYKALFSSFKPINKIMNGFNTTNGEYPFIVAIFFKNEYVCTGTLISPRHILTAAHCFASESRQTYLNKKCNGDEECLKKYLGNNSKEKCVTDFLRPKQIIQDYQIGFGSNLLKNMKFLKLETIDPNYQQFFHSGCHQSDLAILTLALDGNEKLRPYVCLLHTTNLNLRDEMTTVSTLGWGKDPRKKIARHEILQKLYIGYVSTTKICHDSWKPFPIDAFCAKENPERDPCDGDGGGPLIAVQKVSDQIFRYVMVGLLSFGTDCQELRENTKPETSVFTRLDFFQQKINEIIGWKNENFDDLDFNGIY